MYRLLKLPLFVFVIYSPDDGTWFPKHVGIKVCFCCVPSGSIPFWRQIKFGAALFGAVFIGLKIPHAPRGAPVLAPREGPDLP